MACNKEIIKKLLVLFKPYIRLIISIMFLLIVSIILNLFIPIITKCIIDEGFMKNDFSVILIYSIIEFVLVCLDKSLTVIKEVFRADINAKVTYSLYEKAYDYIFKIKIQYFNNKNNTEIFNDINVDIQNISRITDGSALFVVTEIFSMIGGIIGLLIISWKVSLLVLCFIPIKYISVAFFSKYKEKIQNNYIESISEFTKWFSDTIGGIREIRIFGALDGKKKEFQKKQESVVSLGKKLTILDSCNSALELILIQLLIILIYVVGANMIFNLQLTFGSIIAFITYSAYVTTPISTILNVKYILSGIIPSAKRFFEFLQLDIEEQFLTEKEKGISLIENLKFDLRFNNVSFSYISGKRILKNVTFEILEGEKVAIIGANGSGKSTVIDLILRFYEPQYGAITLGGLDIRNFNIDNYRKQISVVNQNIYLFDSTIQENIKLYSDISDYDIEQAIKDSQLQEFVLALPREFCSGQNGAILSGGQRQKIAMARALAHKRKLLIWDEATSNLDIESEININKLLDKKLEGRTVIIVTHRLKILKQVDKIILIDDGCINQIGTHEELLKHNNLYKDMLSKLKTGENMIANDD